MWEGRLHFTTPMLFALGFVSMFVIGGLSGIYLGAVPIDIHASDTYFVVAHIHYVLFGGSVFTIFAGVYYWFPKMTGRMYDERLGKLHFWMTFVSFNATFFPMHWVGLVGMPRRVADYAERFGDLNFFISIASFVLGASVIVFFYNVISSWMRGPVAPANPWRAMTLEWQVSSPPPVFNFDEMPQVVGGPYEYGVPGARHAVMNGDRAGVAGARGGGARVTAAETEQRRVLVVANETLAGDELVEAVRRRAARGPIQAVVVAPVNEPSSGYVVYEDSRRAAAGRRLDRTVARLREAGIPAYGEVVESGPLDAVKDTLAQERIDEIIVSTHPESKSGWLRRNLDRRDPQGGRRAARRARRRRRVRASRRQRAGRRERDRARRAAPRAHPHPREGGPGQLPDRLSAERPEPRAASRGGAAPAPGARVAACGGHRGARPGRAPGPVHRRHAVDRGRADGRDHRLDVPRRALRLAAQRPRGATPVVVRPARGARRQRPASLPRGSSDRRRAVTSHAEAHVHHGPPPANRSSRLEPATLGILLFIASEAMLFGAFFTAYFFIRVVNPDADPWPLPPFELPVFVAGVNTCILLTSSFTMHWALQSIKRGNRAGLQAGLVLTFLMGLAFLLTQMIEYANVGFNPSDGAFGTIFFGLTGLHGAHVFVGLTLLLIATIRAFRGHFTPEHHHGVELPGIYWHFVDVMWIVVYATIYLL